MEKGLYLVLVVISCFVHIHASVFLNGKDATSFLWANRVRRSSDCFDDLFCSMNSHICFKSDSFREVIRQRKCSDVRCSPGEKCEIQTQFAFCANSIYVTQCVADPKTQSATLVVSISALCLVVILMIVITVLIVYICKKKGTIFPQKEPKDLEYNHESQSRTPVVWPANTTFRNE